MTRNPINIRFNKKQENFFPLLAFAVPLLVRAIPEILMGPYLVGFDTIGYYVPGTLEWLESGIDFWAFISDAPFLYLFTIGVASAGGSIVILLKIMAPVLLGLLGLTVYFYASKVLAWSAKKSIFAVFFATLYFAALRVSWDMFRCELGLIFLFIALILIAKKEYSLKNGVLLSFALAFVVLSHQLVTVIMLVILIATIARSYLDKNKRQIYKILLCATPAAFLFLFIIYVNYFVYSLPATGFSDKFSAGFAMLSGLDLAVDTLGFLAFCYLPLLPFLLFGVRQFKSNIQLKSWIIWLFIPIVLVILSPTPFFVGGVLPYRWILLMIFPLSFYAAQGVASIRWNWYKIAVGAFLVVLSFGFLASPNSEALAYYHAYPEYVPKSMLQNTLQLSDCQDTTAALLWARDNLPLNARLLTHQVFYGWATLTIEFDRIIFYAYEDPVTVAQSYSNSTNSLYLIWWVNGTGWYGQPTIPASFQETYHNGNIAIYKYQI